MARFGTLGFGSGVLGPLKRHFRETCRFLERQKRIGIGPEIGFSQGFERQENKERKRNGRGNIEVKK